MAVAALMTIKPLARLTTIVDNVVGERNNVAIELCDSTFVVSPV